ncbi:biliverdin-producing heme oxygenase [Streptomyces zingiberis]|uniref:Biliverdin-producing heme oxygenase n=1 Tax=Streptomyces zingiberis TaxID=2053010 RepID=A0ABX1BW69_9ACTN|nr:biliverdin-producing heme oxygenase [Streptomyces zingiberis]NJP99666.1 biliverdin-producing heme oxygenase [Streptomyces zingiberis]
MDAPSSTPFSARIRAATQAQHTEAENAPFVGDMLGGRLGVSAYALYTEQLWFVYRALEEQADTLSRDPVAGPFIRPELRRVPELERDLDHLLGPGGRARSRPLPATATYADRIAEVSRGWPAGYVAHHYTRYLGDLSGGQIIRATAEKTWGFTPKGDGVRFYVFEGLGSPSAFKREYRARLDALPVDEAEKQRVIEECRRAFALNTALFRDLGERAAERSGGRPLSA